MKNLFPVFFLLSLSLKSQTVHFVDLSALGLNTGASWENAFISFQSALSLAQAGDEIWVAKGTYQPSPSQDRTARFQIPCKVKVYGGFDGSETSPIQRNILANPSILDGNIGNSDLSTDNVYHVVYVENCDSTTLLDGFIIKNGYANGNGVDGLGGGLLFKTTDPSVETTALIRNCEITLNYAVRGGGFASDGETLAMPGIRVEHSTFLRNKSLSEGGAIHIAGQLIPGRRVVLDTCFFTECRTVAGSGGAVSLESFGGVCLIDGCAFEKDSTPIGLEGGGIQMILAEASVTLSIKNCEFNACYSAAGGGLFVDDYGFLDAKIFQLTIEKTIFKNNRSFNEGGGLLIHNVFKGIANVKMDQVIFESNHSAGEGAGAHFYNQMNSILNINIVNSKFVENRGNVPGGGAITLINIHTALTTNNILINNCVFFRNRGAYSITTGNLCHNYTHILNSTFVDNSKYVFNKSWFPNSSPETNYNYMDIHNCVMIDTTALRRIFYNNMFNPFTMHDYRVDHCLLNKPDCIFEGGSVCGEHMLYDVDPAFTDNTFVPGRCSPLVNAGNNFWPDTFNILTDLLQNARILFDTVDIGAYETTEVCLSNLSAEPADLSALFRLLKNPLKPREPITIQSEYTINPEVKIAIFNSIGLKSNQRFELNRPGDQIIIPANLESGIYFIHIQVSQRHQFFRLIVVD